MESPGVFLCFFLKFSIVNIKNSDIYYWPSSTAFLMNSCFSSSSVNAKHKFWGMSHLLYISVNFATFSNE